MFLTLQFLIVSASITSTALGSDSGLHTCQQKGLHKFDNKFLYKYQMYNGHVQVNTTIAYVKTDFQMPTVYAYMQPTTIDLSLYVSVKLSDHMKPNILKWKFQWKHVGHAVAAARIVQSESHVNYEIDYNNCLVTTITRDDQWIYKNASDGHKLIDLPPLWHLLSHDGMTEIRRFGLSCLREGICARMKNLIPPLGVGRKQNSSPIVINVTVNEAVDKSLIRIREEVTKFHETVRIPDKRRSLAYKAMFPNINGIFGVTGGTFTNLSAIERSGDAVIAIQSDIYTITSTYTLRKAYIHLDNFHMQNEWTEFEGEGDIYLKDLEVTGSSAFNVKQCYLIWPHIKITNIGNAKYILTRIDVLKGGAPELRGQVPSSMHVYLKELFESSLVQALRNTFDYSDTIFGPCMTHPAHIMLKPTNR